jgi:hypothetical protein
MAHCGIRTKLMYLLVPNAQRVSSHLWHGYRTHKLSFPVKWYPYLLTPIWCLEQCHIVVSWLHSPNSTLIKSTTRGIPIFEHLQLCECSSKPIAVITLTHSMSQVAYGKGQHPHLVGHYSARGSRGSRSPLVAPLLSSPEASPGDPSSFSARRH